LIFKFTLTVAGNCRHKNSGSIRFLCCAEMTFSGGVCVDNEQHRLHREERLDCLRPGKEAYRMMTAIFDRLHGRGEAGRRRSKPGFLLGEAWFVKN
jgi:hypothetical protein